jgi:hypothetical protein
MWEDKPEPFKLKFVEEGKYELYYKGEIIADGLMPPEIIQSMVYHMNFAYNDGVKDGKEASKDKS